MNIFKSTRKYESWLTENTSVLKNDLDLKHVNMASDPFPFFRSTFYRWIQLFGENCPELTSAPEVVGVGDLHVENFGTWRDTEGRLVWGINDFDEAYPQPYTNDLVRLATSAHLAINENNLKLNKADACDIILRGYTQSMDDGGGAFVLNGQHKWLHDTATFRLKDPVKFWEKLNSFEDVSSSIPSGLLETLLKNLQGSEGKYKVVQRIAGLGSLGRRRFVLISNWKGGLLAREAKAFVPSAYSFIDKRSEAVSYISEIIDNPLRCPDPFLIPKKNWIIRRLAPDCSRIELDSLPRQHDEVKLLYSMGWETATIHMGSKKAVKTVRKDISSKKKHWLHEASEKMLCTVEKDFNEWKEGEKEVKS